MRPKEDLIKMLQSFLSDADKHEDEFILIYQSGEATAVTSRITNPDKFAKTLIDSLRGIIMCDADTSQKQAAAILLAVSKFINEGDDLGNMKKLQNYKRFIKGDVDGLSQEEIDECLDIHKVVSNKFKEAENHLEYDDKTITVRSKDYSYLLNLIENFDIVEHRVEKIGITDYYRLIIPNDKLILEQLKKEFKIYEGYTK